MSSNDGGEKKMRKFAAFWTRMRRKRREQRNKVPVDAIDEMRLKSAEASVMCKKPTRGADDEQRGRTRRWLCCAMEAWRMIMHGA